MAGFNTKCPHCSAELQAQEEWTGMKIECPVCKQLFQLCEKEKTKGAENAKNPSSPFSSFMRAYRLSIWAVLFCAAVVIGFGTYRHIAEAKPDTKEQNTAKEKRIAKGTAKDNVLFTVRLIDKSNRELHDLQQQEYKSQEQEYKRKMKNILTIGVISNGNGPFVIKKQYHWQGNWSLLIVPVSEKKLVHNIWNLYQEFHKYMMERDEYEKKANGANNQKTSSYQAKTYFYEAAAGWTKLARESQTKAFRAREEAGQLLTQLRKQKPREIDMSTNICSLSNLTTPVVLVAFESFWGGSSGIDVMDHFWYMEYTPGQSPDRWDITERF